MHGFARVLQIIISVLLLCDELFIVALRCKGGLKNCPMAIADLVLLYNKAAEAVTKSDHVGFDFCSVIADAQALMLKYCKPLLGVLFSNCPCVRGPLVMLLLRQTTVHITAIITPQKDSLSSHSLFH